MYEYQVIPAPRKAKGGRGLRGNDAKFAAAISGIMNDMAKEGWQFYRSETLPCDERQGLTGRVTRYHSVLVFQRWHPPARTEEEPGPTKLASEEDPESDASAQPAAQTQAQPEAQANEHPVQERQEPMLTAPKEWDPAREPEPSEAQSDRTNR